MTKPLHMTIAPKGGIGKSYIASLITQWLIETGQDPIAFDNDPATSTLRAYKALRVRQLDLVRDGVVNKHAYDQMFMTMANEGTSFVVDNGASNFLELLNYIHTSGLMEVMVDAGVKPIVHVPIVGGDDLLLTLGGFEQLAETLSPAADLVVWKNLYKGDIAAGGTPWEKMAIYQKHKSRVFAEVCIEHRDEMTNHAVQRMLTDRLTFRETMGKESYNLFEKQRLKRVSTGVFAQLTQLFGAPQGVEAS